MAWDDTKSAGDLIKSADWNDMVDFIKYDSIFKVAKYYDRFLYFPCSYTDNWETYTSGTGSVYQGFMQWTVSTGTMANSESCINLNNQMISLGKGGQFARLGQKILCNYMSGDSTAFVGIVQGTKLSGQTDSTLSTIHAGLFYDNGVWYASVSDGSQQKTDITSDIPSGSFWLEIKRDWENNLVFYINNSQVASFTVNSAVYFYGYYQIYVNNESLTTDEKMYLYSLLYEMKY